MHSIKEKTFTPSLTSAAINRALLSSCCLLSLSLTVSPVFADESKIDVITVTAEKRDASLMEVPSSISAKTSQELQDAEVVSITDLGQQVPNLHIFTWGGRRDNNLFIRGVGPGLFTDPTVGFYVDGVSYSGNGMFDMDLADIERVEVLRGPQGTLYGGNSLAGIINIITKKPGDFSEGSVRATVDDLGRKKLSGSFSAPLIENTLYFGAAASTQQDDGHLTNIYNNQDFGERDDTSGRFKLRWTPNERWETNLVIDAERFRGDSYAMGNADAIKNNPDQINHNYHGIDDRDSIGVSLSVEWQGDTVNVTSITGWRDWESINSADQDTGTMAGYVFHQYTEEEQKQLSQELRISSNTDSDLQWIGGLYAYQTDFTVDAFSDIDYSAFGWGGPYVDTIDTEKDNSGYAVFGQLDYSITDQITLTAGLRLDKETRESNQYRNNQSQGEVVSVVGKMRFDEWLPKIGLSYQHQDGSLTYGSVSKGYRAGGFDHLYPDQNNPTYDSETSINYELGHKTYALDGRLSLSAALFWIDIKDQQIQQLIASTNKIVTDNAGEGRSYGLELETLYKPTPNWLLSLGVSTTHAEFKEYASCSFTDPSISCNGNKMTYTPDFTINAAAQNRYPLNEQFDLFTRVDIQHIDNYFFDAQNTFEQDAYQLVNLKFGVEAENWQIYAWAKNALDEYYSSTEFDFGAGHTAEAGDPRSIGITLSAQF